MDLRPRGLRISFRPMNSATSPFPRITPRHPGKKGCLHEFYSPDGGNFKKIDLSPVPSCADGPELHHGIREKFHEILLKILPFWNMKEIWSRLRSKPK